MVLSFLSAAVQVVKITLLLQIVLSKLGCELIVLG